jgi:Putative peptidoglycan binding domain
VETYTQTDLDRTLRVAALHNGGQYAWGKCERHRSDCSGFMSILINAINEDSLYRRLFGTGNWVGRYADLGFKVGLGDSNDFSLGFIYPWESRSGIGHVAGTLGTVAVESRGSRGVLVGVTARHARDELFRHHFHLPIIGKAKPKPVPTSYPPFPGYLRRGSRGEHVRKYQAQMHHRGWRLAVDGDFGPRTWKVTLAFQREKRLAVDGVVGPATWRAAFTSKIT